MALSDILEYNDNTPLTYFMEKGIKTYGELVARIKENEKLINNNKRQTERKNITSYTPINDVILLEAGFR